MVRITPRIWFLAEVTPLEVGIKKMRRISNTYDRTARGGTGVLPMYLIFCRLT
jgi:hypothetical protein